MSNGPRNLETNDRGSSSSTSATLLGRLRRDPSDSVAWNELVHRYGPRVFAWCQRWRLQDSDAHDVTQAVLMRLLKMLPDFEYDSSKSFRALLKTLAKYASIDLRDRQHKAIGLSGDAADLAPWNEVAASNELEQSLQQEYERELLAEAMSRVARRVQPKTWEAFRLLAIEGVAGAEVAERLGMKVSAAYVAKSSVQKMLREEIQRTEEQ
jgi:RNA polymerase sigma-70 factor (ECF subfamily)